MAKQQIVLETLPSGLVRARCPKLSDEQIDDMKKLELAGLADLDTATILKVVPDRVDELKAKVSSQNVEFIEA
jgi:hypothetical protein